MPIFPSKPDKVLFRVDASLETGLGHAMRCLALAQAWRDGGGKITFAMSKRAPSMEERLKQEGMEVVYLKNGGGGAEDALETAGLVAGRKADWVVADGYQFQTIFQRMIKESGYRLFLIDDYGHTGDYHADFILNENVYAHEDFYKNREHHTQLLLGGSYALLRREFLRWRDWRREIPKKARKVLVTLGGTDPDNITLKVIQALQHLGCEDLEVTIVVGSINPHYESLSVAVREASFPVRLVRDVDDMADLMATADLAISSAGHTCLELAFMGLPSLLITLVEHQRFAAEAFQRMRAAVGLGWHCNVSVQEISQAIESLLSSAKERREVAARCRELVPGEGVELILAAISDTIVSPK